MRLFLDQYWLLQCGLIVLMLKLHLFLQLGHESLFSASVIAFHPHAFKVYLNSHFLILLHHLLLIFLQGLDEVGWTIVLLAALYDQVGYSDEIED